jgi:hypothetical protein
MAIGMGSYGNSSYSSCADAMTIPATPVVTATSQAGGVKLEWKAVPNATSYGVWRRDATNTGWIELVKFNETEWIDTTGRFGVTETYAVRAYIGTKYSDYIRNVTGTVTTIGVPQVTAAGGVKGTTLMWDKVNGATGYGVWRQDNGKWVELADGKTSTAMTYFDSTIKSGATATYAVRAYIGKAYSGYISVTSTPIGIPQVTAVSGVNGITLTWSPIAEATGYGVWRLDNGKWVQIANAATFEGLTYTDPTIKSGAEATYAVRAYVGTSYSDYISVTRSAASSSLAFDWTDTEVDELFLAIV